jgi:hypothetical protein
MQGLDAHYSAQWVENERKELSGKPTAKYTVTVAVEGYVEVEIEAVSRVEAEALAREKVELEAMAYADLLTITELSITDVEKWK